MRAIRSGRLLIVTLGTLSAGFANDARAQDARCESEPAEEFQRQAEQKLVLLERLIGDTEPAKRVDASGDADAIVALADARRSAGEARRALDSGCNTDAARLAATGLEQASISFRRARDDAIRLETEYRQLRERCRDLIRVLIAQPAVDRGIDAADMAGIERQVERAEELAINGEFSSANGLLLPVADRLERRIIAIFDDRTLVYDRTFSGPEDEFDYLREQYRGYRLLLSRFTAERNPPHVGARAFARSLDDAEVLASEAERLARAEDWNAAREAMQGAIRQSERAMRMLGVGY